MSSAGVAEIKGHVDATSAKIISELSARIDNLAKIVEDFRKDQLLLEGKLTAAMEQISSAVAASGTRRTRAAATEAEPGTEQVAAAAPAAAPKGAKGKNNAGKWFTEKYESTEEFRTNVRNMPEIKAVIEKPEIRAAVAKKKTDKTKMGCESTAIINNCAEIVNRLFEENAAYEKPATPE